MGEYKMFDGLAREEWEGVGRFMVCLTYYGAISPIIAISYRVDP